MSRLLTNQAFAEAYGDRLRAICAAAGHELEPLFLPEHVDERLDAATLAQIEVAGSTADFDLHPVFSRRFLGSAVRAPNLRWIQLPNAGIDHPVFGQLLARGVRLTTASGAA